MDPIIKDEIYRFLFENSFDAIFLSQPNGKIFRANLSACEMFQRSEEELCQVGRAGVIDVYDPRLKEALEARAEFGKVRAELSFKRKDGSIFPADCVSTIFKDAEEKTWTVNIIRDISAFKQAEDTLRKAQEEATHYATYDYLTGTLNRRAFLNLLQQELSRSKRYNIPLSFMILDLDRFKHINDTMEHSCGDAVLKNISRCLAENLRPYDTLGRYGGDEFIIYMPNTDYEQAYKIAERLRKQIESVELFWENEIFRVTISAGLTSYESSADEDVDSLIIKADKNLYLAKTKRNTVS